MLIHEDFREQFYNQVLAARVRAPPRERCPGLECRSRRPPRFGRPLLDGYPHGVSPRPLNSFCLGLIRPGRGGLQLGGRQVLGRPQECLRDVQKKLGGVRPDQLRRLPISARIQRQRR